MMFNVPHRLNAGNVAERKLGGKMFCGHVHGTWELQLESLVMNLMNRLWKWNVEAKSATVSLVCRYCDHWAIQSHEREAESKDCLLNICRSSGFPRDEDDKKNTVNSFAESQPDGKSEWGVAGSALGNGHWEHSRDGLWDWPLWRGDWHRPHRTRHGCEQSSRMLPQGSRPGRGCGWCGCGGVGGTATLDLIRQISPVYCETPQIAWKVKLFAQKASI